MRDFSIRDRRFEAPVLEPGLYVVATPIGNLADISIRALETLAGCDLVACEDTRITSRLLNRYSIVTEMKPYHEHNAQNAGPRLIASLKEGQVIALVSDAGTPLISDPGYRLITQAIEAGIPVHPVPGASAPMAALAVSGLPTDRFEFLGFLPSRKGQRQRLIESVTASEHTLVFFESPQRLLASLEDFATICGPDRQAVVCRELTKRHEEIARGSLSDLKRHFEGNPVKGEIVLVLAPGEENAGSVDPDVLLRDLLATMPVSRAAAEAARLSGLPKRDLYQRALTLDKEADRKSGRKPDESSD